MFKDMNELKVAVRVGQAVDAADQVRRRSSHFPARCDVDQKLAKVTGMAGRPKQITGFQTRTTPVLLNFQALVCDCCECLHR